MNASLSKIIRLTLASMTLAGLFSLSLLAAGLSRTAPPAYAAGETCFATINGTTVYSSTDAGAVQSAVDIANSGDLIKVAGSCAGVQQRNSLTQTVYISQSVTIQGGYTTTWAVSAPDIYPTTLDANNQGRVIKVASGVAVTLVDLTITGGDSAQGGGYPYGGGINNDGVLTVTNSLIISNTAFPWGAGLFNSDRSGALIIQDSTLAYNRSIDGAAIFNDKGSVDIKNLTAYANGSGTSNDTIQNRGYMTVTNSTISGNTGTGLEIYSGGSLTATTTLSYTTIISNGYIGLYATGSTTPTINMQASVVAYNSLTDCSLSKGIFNDGGYNLIKNGACISAGTSLSGDPKLGPLSDNGGETQTHAPLYGSPVLDAIPAGSCGLSTDQRGVSRPQASGCDIGAYEEVSIETIYLPIIVKNN